VAIKAVISENPLAKLWDEPERIKTVDITNCVMAIQALFAIAKEVNNHPTMYGDVAQSMAQIIINISKVAKKEW
jgi:hypothetical protein